jgi:hypothetical protein
MVFLVHSEAKPEKDIGGPNQDRPPAETRPLCFSPRQNSDQDSDGVHQSCGFLRQQPDTLLDKLFYHGGWGSMPSRPAEVILNRAG